MELDPPDDAIHYVEVLRCYWSVVQGVEGALHANVSQSKVIRMTTTEIFYVLQAVVDIGTWPLEALVAAIQKYPNVRYLFLKSNAKYDLGPSDSNIQAPCH